jgi:hypothetical protein
MTGGNQVFDDGRADEAGGSGNKHAHGQTLQISWETSLAAPAILVK